jgi:mRNA interferase HicA
VRKHYRNRQINGTLRGIAKNPRESLARRSAKTRLAGSAGAGQPDHSPDAFCLIENHEQEHRPSPARVARRNICVDTDTTEVLYLIVTSNELKRWLEKQGGSFASGKGGHLIVRLGSKKAVLPMHGKSHELPTGTVNGIKKALGLK